MDSLLLENGSYLLAEDSGYILLEPQSGGIPNTQFEFEGIRAFIPKGRGYVLNIT